MIPLAAPTPTPSPLVTVVVAGLGQHDEFEVWASIVLPAVVGVGTVLVSIVSLVVARRALQVSQSVAERDSARHESTQRRERFAIKGKFEHWFMHELIVGELSANDPKYGDRVNLRGETRTALEVMSDKAGLELMSWLETQLLLHHAKPRVDQDEVLFAGIRLIDQWALDPSSVEWVQSKNAFMHTLGAENDEHEVARPPEA